MPIKSPKNQITLFLDPISNKGKQTFAYALTYSLAILEIDIRKSPFTGTQLLEIANLLNITIGELANIESPDYKRLIGGTKKYDDENWIMILTRNPEVVRSPIAMKGSKAIIVNTPTDILRL